MDNIQIVERLVAEGKFQEAIDSLSDLIADVTAGVVSDERSERARALADLYFRRGKLWWRLGNRSAATSDYAHASALDPVSPAAKALEQARAVADFFNHDLYNP